MRNKFDEQLDLLNVELIKMGALCEEAIAFAAKKLINDDNIPEDIIIEADKKIDQMERIIEALCIKLILQQQPVAKDLRMISAAMKMISDMERIGDQAYDIVDISRFITDTNIIGKVHIEDMARATIKMVTDSINSFVDKDLELARKVIADDDEVDMLFNKVKSEIVAFIQANSNMGEECLDMLMIAKYFERIGDHATNIAEWVEYSMTGIYKGEYL